MRYIGWAAMYEGASDALYLDILLPRVIRDLIGKEGTHLAEVPDGPSVRLGQSSREITRVAREACDFRASFDIIFIHGDMGGRALERNVADRTSSYCQAINELCAWPCARCLTISPRHETEAWVLSDVNAITEALGYRGSPIPLGLPSNARDAERLADPKQVLATAVQKIRGDAEVKAMS